MLVALDLRTEFRFILMIASPIHVVEPVKTAGKGMVGHRFARLTIVSLLFGLCLSVQGGRDRTGDLNAAAVVRPLFDLRSPERSPFPSDAFTVPDNNQNTGRRVNLRCRRIAALTPSTAKM